MPFVTALAPSKRYATERGKRYKKVAGWVRQMLLQVGCWLLERSIMLVADSGYGVLVLLARCSCLVNRMTVVARLRLDAALYEPTPLRKPKQNGRVRVKGKRLPMLQQAGAAWYRQRYPHSCRYHAGTARERAKLGL